MPGMTTTQRRLIEQIVRDTLDRRPSSYRSARRPKRPACRQLLTSLSAAKAAVLMKPAVARIITSVLRIHMLLFGFTESTATSNGWKPRPGFPIVEVTVGSRRLRSSRPFILRGISSQRDRGIWTKEGFPLLSARAVRKCLLANDRCRIFPGCAGIAGDVAGTDFEKPRQAGSDFTPWFGVAVLARAARSSMPTRV